MNLSFLDGIPYSLSLISGSEFIYTCSRRGIISELFQGAELLYCWRKRNWPIDNGTIKALRGKNNTQGKVFLQELLEKVQDTVRNDRMGNSQAVGWPWSSYQSLPGQIFQHTKPSAQAQGLGRSPWVPLWLSASTMTFLLWLTLHVHVFSSSKITSSPRAGTGVCIFVSPTVLSNSSNTQYVLDNYAV